MSRPTGILAWIDDLLWAFRMVRARRLRRNVGFLSRVAFDDALRPRLDPPHVIAYPDAFYHSSHADFDRAMRAAAGGRSNAATIGSLP